MSNSLQRAVTELQDDLERYNISVSVENRYVTWNGFDRYFEPYMPKKEILVILRKFIRAAKRTVPLKNQVNLL